MPKMNFNADVDSQIVQWRDLRRHLSQKGMNFWKAEEKHVQWSFWLKKELLSQQNKKYFEKRYDYLGRYGCNHDIHEWHGLNLEEYEKTYLFNKDREKLEFVKKRFQLFAKRVNKKYKLFLNHEPLRGDLIYSFLRYFKIQKEYMILQEKLGYNEAHSKMYVSKEKLLQAYADYSQPGMQANDRQALINMIYQYVFFKTYWYADIQTLYYVDISDKLLEKIQKKPDQYSIDLLCLQLLLLADGKLTIGINTDFMQPQDSDFNRLRPSRSHVFTWVGYERLNKQKGIVSAMVPRRVPDLGKKEITLADGTIVEDTYLKSFNLSHYAIMLNDFQLPIEKKQIDVGSTLDYNEFLPLSRMEPFKYEKFKICEQNDTGRDKTSYSYMANHCIDYSSFFVNSFSGNILRKDFIISPQKEHQKAVAYNLTCQFRFKFDQRYSQKFVFEKHCYEQDPDGFWQFNPDLATEQRFNEDYKKESMPDAFIDISRSFFNQEILLCQKHVYSVGTPGYQAGNNNAMQSLQKFEQQRRLSKVLQMLPIVEMQLNSAQKMILNSPENLFILGRSGTGKTTTTVLRFFCQEIMFLAMRKQHRLLNHFQKSGLVRQFQEQKKSLPSLTDQDVNEPSSVKMVFVTASPVLTNEVKQYYTSLKQQLSAHLLVVKKASEEVEEQDAEEESDAKAQVEPDKDQENKQKLDAEREKLLKFLEIREQEIIQSEQIEQQLQLPNQVHQLRPQHYPLFLTVQRLVYMLDASLYHSFFSRKHDGDIIGMESSLGWHNEDRGVFMINQDYKQSDDLKQQLQEFELSVLAGDRTQDFDDLGAGDVQMDLVADVGDGNNTDMQMQRSIGPNDNRYAKEGKLDSQFRQRNFLEDNKYDKIKQKYTRKGVEEFPLCQEVTLELFVEKFMPRMQRFMTKSLAKRLSPSFIWTEIMSVIKGSIHQQFEIYQSYLKRKEYVKHGSRILSAKEKYTIYYIFLKYEEWKMKIRAFDFLDVVNHVLVEVVQKNQYDHRKIRECFDYLIIDEVQDLYPKTIKLLLYNAKYKVVFAGDTAQTIAKGVSTRISDMRGMLSDKGILKTNSINLSVNYRSQNSILQLANNVVKLIETIFPESIDKMTEEVSERQGEKPYLIDPLGDELLCNFLFGKTITETSIVQEEFSIIEDAEDDIDEGADEEAAQRKRSLKGGRVITPHFGASQVIIVRDQHVKDELPEFMKSMLCLTVYESKGLEFDDVILFNFFAMGEIKSNLWKLLGHIREEQSYRTELPDWIMDVAPGEEEAYIESAVEEAIQVYRLEQKAMKEAKKLAEEEEAKQKAEEANDVQAQAQEQVQQEEEEKQPENQDNLEKDDLDDEIGEDDPEEQKMIQEVRQVKQAEFIKIKYDAAIEKFESTEDDSHSAQFIKEFHYNLVGFEDSDPGEIQRRYQMMCTELKFLYVAITRPKIRLYIYDEDTEARKPLEAIWMKLGAVQKVTKEQLLLQQEQKQDEVATINTSTEGKANIVGSLGNSTCDPERWKFQGLRFLKQKNYTQAIKCFTFAGDRNLALRCKAFIAAQTAQDVQQAVDTSAWEYKRRIKFMTRNQKQSKMFQMKKERIQACRQFHLAGLAFERAKIPKFAASCYFTARNYSKAAEIFKQLEQWSQVGECLTRIGKSRYREAATFFEKGDLILRAIECYEQIGEWELLLHCLNRSQEKFGDNERLSLINKYVPVALNNIYQQYGMVDRKDDDALPTGDQGNVGQKAQQKIEDKYKVNDAIVEEEDLDEYGEELDFHESDDDSTEEVKTQEQEENKEDTEAAENGEANDAEESGESDEDDGNIMSKGFQLETIIKQQYKKAESFEEDQGEEEVKGEKNAADDDSYDIIDSMDEENQSQGSQPDEEQKLDNDQLVEREDLKDRIKNLGDSFDHLSQYDPDDEFLKSNRSLSIIGSIIGNDGRGGQSAALSESSEFSIISSNNVKSLVSSFMSEAKGQALKQINFIDEQDDDNYVQDVIAQKIIYYLSLWSVDMRKQLDELKRRGILNEVSKDAQNETIDETDFIIQMDDVDQDFVNLILDTLEMYEFYHMSLMMCKRYRLSGRQGRYLVLMCSKYSNLNRNRINFTKMIKSVDKLEKQRACSLISHEAIHNVLCLIDSNYLKMKDFGQRLTDDDSLGMQAYMTILNLGFWKKLVYILEKKISLHLCMKFFDFKNYLMLMKVFMTQEEKIQHKGLLEVWTIKSQVKEFLLQKQRIMTKEVKKTDTILWIDQLCEESSELISAIQLNQKSMQNMLQLQKKIAEFLKLNSEKLKREERTAKLEAIKLEIDQILQESLKPFSGKNQSDQLKFVGASMLFDLCFNQTSAKLETRVQQQIVGELTNFKTSYSLLQEAYEKIENYTVIDMFDPVIEAMYATNLISTLENEDHQDPQMQNLFQFYSDSHMLVSIHSNIINDVIYFQNLKYDNDVFTIGERANSKLSYFYFDPYTRTTEIQSILKNSNSTSSLDQWKSSDRNLAFIADMDAQFVFVPKAWIRYILLVKIARIQSNILTKGYTPTLEKDKFLLNKALIAKLTHLNSRKVDGILKQAYYLRSVRYSDFWKKIYVMQNINYTAVKLIEAMSTTKIITQHQSINLAVEYRFNSNIFGGGLVPDAIPKHSVDNASFNKYFEDGQSCLLSACGKRFIKIGRDKDHEEFCGHISNSIRCFVSIQNTLPFEETLRRVFKKEKKKIVRGQPDDFIILRNYQIAANCQLLIKNGQWLEAAQQIMSISAVKPEAGKLPWYNALSLGSRMYFLEFATVIVFLLKFKVSHLPDYALRYVDESANFDGLYEDTEDGAKIEILRKISSLSRQKSLEKRKSQQSKDDEESKKSAINIVGEGKKFFPVQNSGHEITNFGDEYYDEMATYKREEYEQDGDGYGEEDYEEESKRMLIERNIQPSQVVEKPDEEHVQQVYEQFLQKLVDFLDDLNEDEMCFTYMIEQIRVYNLLMAAVVNDKAKSKKVCSLLGQGFNRLMRGPHDYHFTELGVPDEWSSSNHGSALVASDFDEQMHMFEEADVGLKWQWFTEIHVDKEQCPCCYNMNEYMGSPIGFYVVKIDITAGQTQAAQETIIKNDLQNKLTRTRQLAIRLAAGRQISRALRCKLDEIKAKEKVAIKNEIQKTFIDKLATQSKERVESILAHARVMNIMSLTQLSQINSVRFISKLQNIYSKINYLQELMVVKAFSNSIEISKAISFMSDLRALHEKFCEKARDFAQENADILNQFDLMEQGEDPLTALSNELDTELMRLDTQINLWQFHVFQGNSSGFTISKIIDSQMQVQQRMKLKWQRMKPSSKRQRLAQFKEKMVQKYQPSINKQQK